MKNKQVIKTTLLLCVLLLLFAAGFLYACRTTDIPKLYFQGDIRGMREKTDVRDIAFTYDNGQSVVKGYAALKVQGTSSLKYDKKNYTIKLYSDQAHEEKLAVDLGWGSEYKYCLKANWIDRTHARNLVSAKLACQAQKKYDVLTQAPCNGLVDGFPIEVYSNGVFLGLYTCNIPKDDWQFAMDSDNPNHIVLCGENWEPAACFRDVPDFVSWSVEVGEENEQTMEKLTRLSDFIRNSTDEEFVENFHQYLDLDAALNYYVLADFIYGVDNVVKNMLLVTYDGEVWYPTLYDMDTTWGTDYAGETVYPYREEPVYLIRNQMFERMETLFPQELSSRYLELRQEILTKENVMGLFNDFRDGIPALTFWKEGFRWGDGFLRTHSDLPGYDYDQIEEYLDYVIPALDEKYATMDFSYPALEGMTG